jgi:uncharacterized membrane protein YoaK (UPF0700 family)
MVCLVGQLPVLISVLSGFGKPDTFGNKAASSGSVMLASSATRVSLPVLLSFNGGFVDTAGFLVLQGLFTAHVTGNFVTLAATLVLGTHGVLAKILALPEFAIVLALARLAGSLMRARGMPNLRVLLAAEVCFLLIFFVLAVVFGPFPDSDEPAALLTGFAAVAGMAVQNAVQFGYLAHIPPTTFMTGNTARAVLDAVDLLSGTEHIDTTTVRSRLARTLRTSSGLLRDARRPRLCITGSAYGVSLCRCWWRCQRRFCGSRREPLELSSSRCDLLRFSTSRMRCPRNRRRIETASGAFRLARHDPRPPPE